MASNDRISQMTAATVAQLALTTSALEVSTAITTTPVTRQLPFDILSTFLRQTGFSNAVTAASPAAVSWVFTNGSGSNNAAGDFTLTAPLSTGNATAANLIFQTGVAGGAGSALQTAVTRLTLGSGGVIVGNATAGMGLGSIAALQVVGTDSTPDGSIDLARFSASAVAPLLTFTKSRGAAIGTLAKVVAADNLARLSAYGIADDNTTVSEAARWAVVVPTGGVPAAGTTVSGNHVWSTRNIAGTFATRLTLDSEGTLTLASPSANTAHVVVSGLSLTGANAQTLAAISGTWNTSGTPTAFQVAITNTASNANSLLMQLLAGAAGATSMFSVTAAGTVTAAGSMTIAQGGGYAWGTRVSMAAPATSQINWTESTGGTGVGFDFATDAVLKLRVRAQNAYATLDVLGLKASGAAGASFGPGVPTSLTFVNGICTAAS